MAKESKMKVVVTFAVLIIFILVGSSLSGTLWGVKTESVPQSNKVSIISENMTLREISTTNDIDIKVLQEALKVNQENDLVIELSDLGITAQAAERKINAQLALNKEEATKNWVQIRLKIMSWVVWLLACYYLLAKGKITPKIRKYLLFGAVAIFGVFLGAEPNPMATLTDNIASISLEGYFFPPRLIVLMLFLLTIFLANKLICSWGCQLGTLQDFIFRLNRDDKDKSGIIKQYKLPFAITNSVRIISFMLFLAGLIIWSTNLINYLNPFTLYNPSKLNIVSIGFIGVLLLLSIFTYRPWCHLFCPLGLAGWIIEKFSLHKIVVNRNTCISCEACSKACPSHAMGAILKEKKVIPDCFSCATCINSCPTNSIAFSTRNSKEKEVKHNPENQTFKVSK